MAACRRPAYRPQTISSVLSGRVATFQPASLPDLPQGGAAARQRRIAWPMARTTGRRQASAPVRQRRPPAQREFMTMARLRLRPALLADFGGEGSVGDGAAASGSNTSAKSGSGTIQRPKSFLAPGSFPARIRSRTVSGARRSTTATWSTSNATWPGYCLSSRSSMRADTRRPMVLLTPSKPALRLAV